MEVKLSRYQVEILRLARETQRNLAIQAVAGSGKTFTIKQIAAALPESTRHSAIFVAFSKEIQTTLEKSGLGIAAKTVHSLGFAALRKSGKVKHHYSLVSEYKYPDLVTEYLKESESDLPSGDVCRLIDLVRSKMIDPSDTVAVQRVIDDHDLDVDPAWIKIIPALLQSGDKLATAKKGRIDFTDMLYLPVKWGCNFDQYDLVLADEIQDFSPLQMEVIKRITAHRFIGVGDPNQAIMGFAGADCNSFQAVVQFFNCDVLPLSICYRCPDDHLRLARDFVPDIEGNNKAGSLQYTTVIPDLSPDSMVIARRTAPLISECMRLVKRGIRAYVRAKDLDKSLIRTAKRLFNADPDGHKPNFELSIIRSALDSALDMPEPNPKQIDRLEALIAIWESVKPSDIAGLVDGIREVFKPSEGAITFSSIHAAKGLESDNVVILEGNLLPFLKFAKSADAIAQERNIAYVAYTRSKKSLTIVSPDAPKMTLANTLITMAEKEFGIIPPFSAPIPAPYLYNRALLEK